MDASRAARSIKLLLFVSLNLVLFLARFGLGTFWLPVLQSSVIAVSELGNGGNSSFRTVYHWVFALFSLGY